jgi:hypothetical protein
MFKLRWKSTRAQMVWGLLAIPLTVVCLVSSAFGQAVSTTTPGATDPFHAAYFGNANSPVIPDAQVNIVNPGSLAGYSKNDGHGPYGDLCANIYVFDSDQQLTECCSCEITPNGLLQLSVNNNLAADPYTGVPPVAGDIKIVSSYANETAANACSTTFGTIAYPTAALGYTPVGTLVAWITHSRPSLPTLTTVTETPFHRANLSGTESEKLVDDCYSVWSNGSGTGRCTCGSSAI